MFVVTTFSLSYDFLSIALFAGVVTVTSKPVLAFGSVWFAFSVVSSIPSLSSSLSEFGSSSLSTFPSPSVSLKTLTFTSLTTAVSPSWFTVTSKVISRSSSFGCQSVIAGFPTTFPSPFTLNPFFSVELIVAPGLFGLITFSLLVYWRPSIALFVGSNFSAFSTSSTATSTSSLLPSGYATSTVT